MSMSDKPGVGEWLTLEPLRTDGPDALDAQGIAGIVKITLREIEVAWDNLYQEVMIRRADDVFECAAVGGDYDPIPRSGRLTHAVVEVQFADSAEPRRVEIRPPNTLKFERASDAETVGGWLAARGFRIETPEI